MSCTHCFEPCDIKPEKETEYQQTLCAKHHAYCKEFCSQP